MIPYRYSHIYQDKSILREFYPGMRKYAEFIIKRMGRHTVLSKPLHLKHSLRKYAVNYGQAYGEWAEPADVHPTVWTDMILPKPEVATAYASWMMGMMKEIAAQLDKQEDAERYAFYQAKTKEAYQAIRKTEEYKLDTDRQALLVRPLYLDLLDPEQTKYAKKRLVEALDHYSWRLGTGFLSTPLINCWRMKRCRGGSSCRNPELRPSGNPGKAPMPKAGSLPSITIPKGRAWNGCSLG